MLLEVNNVKKIYDGFELNCSLRVAEGSITGLIGENGAGKSTVFKGIMDLISIDGGEIKILGADNRNMEKNIKENIGVVMSEGGFCSELSVKQIGTVMDSIYQSFGRRQFFETCKRFKLPINKKIKEFSTGMKAKLSLLLAISHDARLLLLDEPTAGLDVVAREEMLDILREYMETEGRGILISSHISSDIQGFCDDVYMIHEGSVIFHEETDAIADRYGIIKLSDREYGKLDKKYIIAYVKEGFGYKCLTDKRQFYMENYPKTVIEKGSIDQLITIMVKGERL